MLYITDEEKHELLDSVDMLELVEDLGFDCKKVGSHYSILCPCPNHSDKNKGNPPFLNNPYATMPIRFAIAESLSSCAII